MGQPPGPGGTGRQQKGSLSISQRMHFRLPSHFPKNPVWREAPSPLVMLAAAGPLPRRLRQHDGGLWAGIAGFGAAWRGPRPPPVGCAGMLPAWPPLSVHEAESICRRALCTGGATSLAVPVWARPRVTRLLSCVMLVCGSSPSCELGTRQCVCMIHVESRGSWQRRAP